MKKFLLKIILLIFASAFIAACSDDDDNGNNGGTTQVSIAATVEADARFTILLDALNRTNLTSELANENAEFTVFAPNDAAFQSLFQSLNLADLDAAETLLTNAGLRNVLLYHVLNTEVKAASVTTGYASTLAQATAGGALSLFTDISSGVTVNGTADVVGADIDATNGVIHEVNNVLLPLSIYQLISLNQSTFGSLDAALKAADGSLNDVLDSDTVLVTLFAPDNSAFDTLIQNTPMVNDLGELVNTLGTGPLANVLLYHVVDGNIRAENVMTGPVNSLAGASFDVAVTGNGAVTITDGTNNTVNVTEVNIQGTNGVVHKINGVILPQ